MKPTIPFLGVCLLFLLSSPLHAGFFDDLKKQAEKAVQDTAKGIAGAVVPGKSQEAEPKPTHQPQVQPDPSQREAALSEPELRGLQICLGRLGYYRGTPDGRYGPGTAAAIRRFQQDRGMAVDSKASRKVVDECGRVYRDPALRAALQKKNGVDASDSSARAMPSGIRTPSDGAYTEYPVPKGHEALLLRVRFQPERYAPEYKEPYKPAGENLYRAITEMYPGALNGIRTEVERKRKLQELYERLLAEAKAIPLTYRVVVPGKISWSSKTSGLVFQPAHGAYPSFGMLDREIRIPVLPDAEEGKMLWGEVILSVEGMNYSNEVLIAKVRRLRFYESLAKGNGNLYHWRQSPQRDSVILKGLLKEFDGSALPYSESYKREQRMISRQKAKAEEKARDEKNTMEITF